MKGIKSVSIKMQRTSTVIISLVLSVMAGVVFLQTFCCLVISRGLLWSEKLSRYLLMTLIVPGVNLMVTDHLFVRIEITDNCLKETAAAMMNLICKSIMIYINIVPIYSNLELILIGVYQASPAMKVPMSLLYGIVFAGFAVNVFASLADPCETYVRVLEEKIK